MLRFKNSRGDTIIEVVIAFTVFSLLAVGALAVMNQGTATAQRALEVTLVRQQIDGQVEAIRYLHQQYSDAVASGSSNADVVQWNAMVAHVTQNATAFGSNDQGKCQPIPTQAFSLNARTATVVGDANKPKSSDAPNSTPYSQVVYDPETNVVVAAYGIWVEAVKKDATQNFIDFHVRTCWYGPGDAPALTLGTIVRLYVPN